VASVVKRNLIAALLVAVAVWPLVHRWIARRYEIDPWKLSGFAMYATPSLPIVVGVAGTAGRGWSNLDEASLPGWVRTQLDRFRVERLALGKLRDPADVARSVLVVRTDLTAAAVLVQRFTLDPDTARIEVSTERYPYERTDPALGLPASGQAKPRAVR
jgi:hypothetical protein